MTGQISNTPHAPTLDGRSAATDVGLLVLRLIFGGMMFGHGCQKLFGWFGGDGWEKTTRLFAAMGYHPGAIFGPLAGLCQFTGGALLFLGLLTPLGAAITLGTMINAMNVTLHHGLMAAEGGLLFAAAAAALAFTGPGRYSLDFGRPWERRGIAWGVGAVVLATVAALIALSFKSTRA